MTTQTQEIKNMRLISHSDLNGFPNIGEGMAMQTLPGGRRIMWLAHECAPKDVTAVDVTDPVHPKVVTQTDLPSPHRVSAHTVCVYSRFNVLEHRSRLREGCQAITLGEEKGTCSGDLGDPRVVGKPCIVTMCYSTPNAIGGYGQTRHELIRTEEAQ